MPRLGLIGLLAGAAALAGCQESGFDEHKETARPLKVQHVLGETKVPGQAAEPMTLSVDTLDDTLALGVRPVRAAVPERRLPAYLRGRAKGVELVTPVRASRLRVVRTAHPDLILGSVPIRRSTYERLSVIAPTVMIAGASGQWKLNVRLMGEALGRTNAAEALLTDYDRRAARTRRTVRRGEKVALVRLVRGHVRVARRDSFAGTVLADAGLRPVGPRAARVVLVAGGGAGGASAGASGSVGLAAATGVSGDGGVSTRLPRGVSGRIERVDTATWWGPGGMLQARAALADLERLLHR